MVILDISAASWTGRVRSQNEDMILVDNQFIRDDTYKTQIILGREDRMMIAVADGMGGHNRGDIASNDTLRNLHYFFYDIPSCLNISKFNEAMAGWLESINNYIASKGRADEQYKGMGTTLVCLAYYNNEFYSLNCGDSRLYRFRDHQLAQLTTDHSLSNLEGDEKRSNIITNCIGGGSKSSFIDMVTMTNEIMPKDVYLLCTDGLTDMLSDKAIGELLEGKADANTLCSAAIEAGGIDNVSCCVITIK
ncbi:MAG: serine/threonine-protein phosphatase [Prevotella sp.]|nr:serine/threonine-protein phosphatase [Prevotella sp.]